MATAVTTAISPVVLVAATEADAIADALKAERFRVIEARTGTLAIEWARELRPDVIVLDSDLPDMSGLDASRALHGDIRIGHTPILILSTVKPSPAERVAALRAGVWDFLSADQDQVDLGLTLQTYVQVKHNIDVAMAGGLADPATGLHTRSALARRARELGALMSRKRSALACVVFALDVDPGNLKPARVMARAGRVSDVVGALGATEFAVLAPGTDAAGAVLLAKRVAPALRDAAGDDQPLVLGSSLRVGYDAVANLMYSPIDPVELLTRAATAARTGVPEADCPWIRHFEAGRQPRHSPIGLVPDLRRSAK